LPDTGPGEPGGAPDQVATEIFVDHRELLFSIVYSMLGSVADTEDVLQETRLSWASRNVAGPAEQITSPRAYLVRIAVNAALARQQAISRRREEYVGPWLPEPLLTGDGAGDGAEITMRAQSVSLALMVVLETLSPLDRSCRSSL
jgi:DNA-directed RNA polymerase specialized sigma24 family protein